MILFSSSELFSTGTITLVYNLRIAETTKNQFQIFKEWRPSIATLTLFTQFRETYNHIHQFTGGGLGTYIFATDTFYARVNAAVGNAHETDPDGISSSRTSTDDILFTAGYGHALNDRTKVTFSAHLGIPTHKDGSLEYLQLGTGHFGAGAQVDGSLKFADTQALMAAIRFIHFFPRTANLVLGTTTEHFKFNIGDAVDLFLTYQGNWDRHQLEIGYNPTFLFSASIHPLAPLIIKETEFIASSFYASYRYGFMLCNLPSAIIIGASYGFDHTPKIYGYKYIVTTWLSWGIKF
jgi:hypothetical protein